MTVIGCGYLGATHAAAMAELGHEVVGIDVDENKVELLNAGTPPFFEPGLEEILARNRQAGRVRFTTNPRAGADFVNAAVAAGEQPAGVHFLGVGTPQLRDSYAADVSYVNQAVDALVPLLTGEHIIAGKSTVPVGTAQRLQTRADALVAESGNADTHIEIVWNPEFLREGHAVDDTLHPDRIVVGVSHSTPVELLRAVYAAPLAEGTPLLTMNLPTAELVKVSANAFLATKISFINAVSEVCEAAGANVAQLAEAIGLDERIGPKFLGAGLGFGGGCLPKDIRAFMARAGELGVSEALTFLREVDSINRRRRTHLVDMVRAELGDMRDKRVTVLGCAFKPESDDIRDSPALDVAGKLSLRGAQVTVYDPQAMDNARATWPTLTYAQSLEEALTGAEAVVIGTEWDEFTHMDPQWVGALVSNRLIVDGRGVIDLREWRASGWRVLALGHGESESL
ncbi:MAG: UDP-glucose/GDP-mannose dehydrogenase family protein [Corynebacterium sp.]|nr:UDP-glucose/GDP-mannose dehydrogenase family protein [Corynebacterium sp.]